MKDNPGRLPAHDHTAVRNETPSETAAAVGRRIAAEFERLAADPIPPGLYVVATPIGNLGDQTLRGLSLLLRADDVRCEDTRHTQILLSRYGIRRPLDAYHEHNAPRERPRILELLARGRSVVLVTDAGTPLISDPGFKLVRAALEQGFNVSTAPGPSAAIAALALSGLPTDAFYFAGFLPPKSAQRRARLKALETIAATLIFFEAPQRLAGLLADAAAVLGARQAAFARELTKVHEEVRRGSLEALAAQAGSEVPKGEFVVLIGPGTVREASDTRILANLEAALQTMTIRDAVRFVADDLGVSRRRVYDLGLTLKEDRP